MGPHRGAQVTGLEAVKAALRTAGVAFDERLESRERNGRDESDQGTYLPDMVVFAEKTEDVQAVLRACQRHHVPVTPVGARTGKSGGSLPVRGGVSLSLERMNRILAVRPDDLLAVAQPGVVLGELRRAVEAHGLMYAPDPNSWESCTLGGTVAENAGGPRALKYGVTRDHVLALEWVLPSGDVVRLGHQTAKGVAGYDLVGLMVGSEGTLGIATEITVRLVPSPRHVRTALISFRTVGDAATASGKVLTSGLWPRALELLDDVALAAVDGKGFTFPAGAGACLLLEVDGSTDDGVLAELAQCGEVCTQAGALDVLVANDAAQRERLWAVRRQVSPALRALKGFKFSEDIVVPRSRMPEAIARFKAIGQALGLTVATYGHAGDGNLHTNVLYAGPAERPRVEEALERIMRATLELEGTITGEHGVGLAKRRFLPLEQAPALIALQRRLKVFFDPEVILNPGKIFED
ncbi:MAG: FAD-binding protein [Archangium sp.]|nr:FAD-binding protein [Archangium sp.]